MKVKNGKPKCSLTDKTLIIETTGAEKKFNVSIWSSKELLIGVGDFPSPTKIGGKLEVDDIHTKVEWDCGIVPNPGSYKLKVIGVDENGKGSVESEPLSLKLKAADTKEIQDAINAKKLQEPVPAVTIAAPATSPATAPIKPPVTPVPPVPVAIDAPAEIRLASASKKAARLMVAIQTRLQSVKSILEGNPEIMKMDMGRDLKHEHAETCQLEFNEITRWVNSLTLNDGGIEQTLQNILDRAGRLKAAVWSLKCQIEERNERQAARRVATKPAQTQPSPNPSSTAPPANQPKPVAPAQEPAPKPPVVPQRPAVAPTSVPPPVIPQVPARTPAPKPRVVPQRPAVALVPKRFGGHKVVAMLLALLAFLAFLFAFGVVIYAMYRSNSLWIGPGANQNHSSDAERAALAEATMAMNNAHQALEAASDRANLVTTLASMPRPVTNVVVISYAPSEQQAPTPVEVYQQPEVVQQQVVVPSYYNDSPDYYPYAYTPVVSFNFGGGGGRYRYGPARLAYGPGWNGSYRHESSDHFRSGGHPGGHGRGR